MNRLPIDIGRQIWSFTFRSAVVYVDSSAGHVISQLQDSGVLLLEYLHKITPEHIKYSSNSRHVLD